jgi:hypothetical protein
MRLIRETIATYLRCPPFSTAARAIRRRPPKPSMFVVGLALVMVGASASPSTASLTQPTNTVEASIHKAIVEGDIQGLRLLLTDASELSASDQAIARRALTSMETLGTKDSCTVLAKQYGINWANKVHHALETATDGPVKQALLDRYGSPEAVFWRVHEVINKLRGLPEGAVEREVAIDGLKVVVRMFIRGTTITISTLLKRK